MPDQTASLTMSISTSSSNCLTCFPACCAANGCACDTYHLSITHCVHPECILTLVRCLWWVADRVQLVLVCLLQVFCRCSSKDYTCSSKAHQGLHGFVSTSCGLARRIGPLKVNKQGRYCLLIAPAFGDGVCLYSASCVHAVSILFMFPRIQLDSA